MATHAPEQPLKIVRVTRTLTYEGPESWVAKCQANSFVELRRELGEGKSITSNWGPVEEIKEKP